MEGGTSISMIPFEESQSVAETEVITEEAATEDVASDEEATEDSSEATDEETK